MLYSVHEVKDQEETPIKIELRVVDNGIGISKENISKLFVNFSTLAEHEQNNPHGTGLGLSICKLLAQKMNGTVYAESQLKKGTTFIFNFKTKCITSESMHSYSLILLV